MKNGIIIFLLCLTAGLAASAPEWKYTLEKGELHVTASLPANEYLYRKTTSVALTAGGTLPLETLISKVFPLSELQNAFEFLTKTPDAMKVLIQCNDEVEK